MFRELAIRGDGGALLHGYAEAAVLSTWHIQRESSPKRGPFALSAVWRTRNRVWCAHALHFTAARLGGGRWFWPVLEVQFTDDHRLTARLGLPEQ